MSSIVLITNQFSVVVKGLEKELRKLKHDVKLVDKGFRSISESDYKSEVLILYLTDSLLEDPRLVKELFMVCDRVKDSNCGMILIGDERYHEVFLKSIPALREYAWLERPVDMYRLSEEIAKESKRAQRLMAKKRVLIVDDDPVYAMMVRNWLMNDYSVATVTDGMQTISFLTNNQVDLILLDYEMPVVDGPKVLQMLRAHPETRHIPVMFLTGIRDKESIQRVVMLKPEGYILKSTSRERILKTLADFFEKQE